MIQTHSPTKTQPHSNTMTRSHSDSLKFASDTATQRRVHSVSCSHSHSRPGRNALANMLRLSVATAGCWVLQDHHTDPPNSPYFATQPLLHHSHPPMACLGPLTLLRPSCISRARSTTSTPMSLSLRADRDCRRFVQGLEHGGKGNGDQGAAWIQNTHGMLHCFPLQPALLNLGWWWGRLNTV